MGARMVAFLESLLSGLDCLDCLAEKGKPESKRHKLETPQLMLAGLCDLRVPRETTRLIDVGQIPCCQLLRPR